MTEESPNISPPPSDPGTESAPVVNLPPAGAPADGLENSPPVDAPPAAAAFAEPAAKEDTEAAATPAEPAATEEDTKAAATPAELAAAPEENPKAAATPAEPAAAEEEDPKAAATPAEPAAAEAPAVPDNKHWYVVKVQSGREESIKEAVERRVKIEELQDFFGQIIIPVERVTEVRGGKRIVKERKLYPGYLMVQVEYNDRILYLFRETSGVGDFVGGTLNHPPQPMKDHEVERMLGSQGVLRHDAAPPKPRFEKGDKVTVKDGTFAGMEGEVKELLEAKGSVRVELTIWGRPVPVELEYWQVEYK